MNKRVNIKYVYYILIIVLVIGSGVMYLLGEKSPNQMSVQLDERQKDSSSEVLAKPTESINNEGLVEALIYVHVCGEIKNPDVYTVSKDSRLFEVIEMAGGYTTEANEEILNLARLVVDGEKIYVPSQEEVDNGNYAIDTSGQLDEAKININTASKEELMQLSGIGEQKAGAIIKYRETNGFFKNIEDIMMVEGIKDAMYKKNQR